MLPPHDAVAVGIGDEVEHPNPSSSGRKRVGDPCCGGLGSDTGGHCLSLEIDHELGEKRKSGKDRDRGGNEMFEHG